MHACIHTYIHISTHASRDLSIQVDALFAFSTEVAQDYTGRWVANDRFELTIEEPFPLKDPSEKMLIGATEPPPERIQPAVGCASCVNAHEFSAAARLEAAISNQPTACLAQASTSPPLEGSFGGAQIEIEYVVADDPFGANDFYSPGDTITVVFSAPTNMAGLPPTNIPKAQIDAIMSFSEPIGADYVGNWRCSRATKSLCKDFELASDAAGNEVTMSRWALEITLLDITGVSGLESCPPLERTTGCDLASIDLEGFTVTLLPQAPYPGEGWASKFSPPGPGVRNFPAQCAPSSSARMGVLGRFGKLLILYSIAPSRLPAAGGHVTITGRGFGWNPRIVSVRIGDLLAADVSLPSGHTFPVPQLVGQTIVALAPPGSGAHGQPLTVSIQDEFSDSSFSATLAGLVFYAAPEIAEVMPTQLRLAAMQAFEATQFVITIQGTNFGLASTPAAPAPRVLIYTESDGVHLCPNVTHVSDRRITCVHTVSPKMRTGGASAQLVVELDGQESARSTDATCACRIRYESVPAFWQACSGLEDAHKRECLECCEPECIAELEGADMTESEPVWDRCKFACFDFCGLTKTRWHPHETTQGSKHRALSQSSLEL